MRSPSAVGLVVLVVSACARPQQATSDEQPGAAPHASAEPRCDAWPPSASDLTRFSGASCPWVVSAHDGELVVRSLVWRATPVVLRGELPEVCRAEPCAFEGAETPLGPLVVATVASRESELPREVWLAVPGRERLGFIDLWAGEDTPVLADSTPFGPAFALAPFECPAGLGLFVTPRLDRAAGAEPSMHLRAREGIYVVTEGALERRDADRTACQRLVFASP